MRDKYNLNTLPPSLAGLEDYEMDDHIMIPGMGGMNEDRPDYGESPMVLNDSTPHHSSNLQEPTATNGAIPGLDLDVSSVRDRRPPPINKPPPKKPQENWDTADGSDMMFGITAHDSGSILTCVREVISGMVKRLPGNVPLADLKPEKIEVYGKEIDVIRKFFKKSLKISI